VVEEFTETIPRWLDRRALALLAIVAAYALYDLCCDANNQTNQFRCLLTGVWLAQPILLGVWAAIGPPPAVKRVPATAITLVLLATACSNNAFTGNSSRHLLETIFIMSGLFIGAAFVMSIIGYRTSWQIASQQISPAAAINQFSLKYLIGMMTFVGFTLAFGRFLMAASPSNATQWSTSLIRLAWVSGVILLGTLPIAAVPIVMLSRRPTARAIVSLLIAWVVTTLSAIQIVTALDRAEWTRIASDLIGFQLGGALAGALTALALRKSGYRLLTRQEDNIIA
jgi:uncharacterized membrane protein